MNPWSTILLLNAVRPHLMLIHIPSPIVFALTQRFEAMGRPLPARVNKSADLPIRDPEGNIIVLSEKGWDPA